MDQAVARQLGPDHFVTAQILDLDIATGHLEWVNAGHPAPLLIRDGQVVQQLRSPPTLPVGIGSGEPRVNEHALRPGDRLLCYTDGVIEERDEHGVLFGQECLIHCVNRMAKVREGARASVRWLFHPLKKERGGRTTDDATLLLIEWRAGAADHLAVLD